MIGHTKTYEGKTIVTAVDDNLERCLLMLYFSRIFGKNGVKPGVRQPLSTEDLKELNQQELPTFATEEPVVPPTKLSKADRKFMARKKKGKRIRKSKKTQPANAKEREMNRKFELLRLKRSMGLDKTVV